ncbi:Ig-like domain-containing protein [Patescibacteria group bacterium]
MTNFKLSKKYIISLVVTVGIGLGYIALANPLTITSGPIETAIGPDFVTIDWTADGPHNAEIGYSANPPAWAYLTDVTPSKNLSGMSGLKGTTEVWGVGYDGSTGKGLVVHTADGNNWSVDNNTLATFSLTAVDAVATNSIWAVGGNGNVINDNGSGWAIRNTGLDLVASYNGVSGCAPNNVWIVGTGGKIYQWNGGSWIDHSNPAVTTRILTDVFCISANEVWAVGYNGTIIEYNGAGLVDHTNAAVTDRRLTNISMETPGSGWIVGVADGSGNYTALRYNGTNWSRINIGPGFDLDDVIDLDSNVVMAVGSSGRIASTSDGLNWFTISTGAINMTSIYASTPIDIWAGNVNTDIFEYVFTEDAIVAANPAPKTINSLAASTPYWYYLKVDDGIDTDYSPIKSFTTTAADSNPPEPPPTFTGTTDCDASGNFWNNLQWTAATDLPPPTPPSGIGGYTLERNGAPLFVDVNKLTHSDLGLAQNTAYSYIIKSLDVANNVSAPSPAVNLTTLRQDWSLVNNSGQQNVVAGNSVSFNIEATAICNNNLAGNLVEFSNPDPANISTDLPKGFTATDVGTIIPVTVSTTPVLAPGNYDIELRGTAGTTKPVTVTIVVSPPPAIDITVNPVSQTVTAGNSTAYTVTINPLNGFSDIVNLSAALDPALLGEVTASFSVPSPFVAGAAVDVTMNVQTTTSAPSSPPPYNITITGVDATTGSISDSEVVTLVIDPAPDFIFTVDQANQTTAAGQPVTYNFTLQSLNGLTDASAGISAAHLSPAPSNVTYTPDLIASSANVSLPANGQVGLAFVIDPAQTATQGTHDYRVTAVAAGITKTIDISLIIQPPLDFTVTVLSDVTMGQTDTATTTVRVETTNGFNDDVTLTLENLPVSANANFVPQPANPNGSFIDVVLTINTVSTPPNAYTVTARGTFNLLSRVDTFTLTVNDTEPPVISNVQVVPGMNDATITWDTNEPATSEVFYEMLPAPCGVPPCTGLSNIQVDLGLKLNHTEVLSGLTANQDYEFQLEAVDAGGNRGQDVVRYFTTLPLPDAIDPVVTLDDPVQETPPQVVNGIISVDATATDNVGVVSVNLFADDLSGTDVPVGILVGPGPINYSWNWDTTTVPSGLYDIYVTASDANANEGTSNRVNLEVNNDTAGPVVSNINVQVIANQDAIITWDTDELATSYIEYGLETSANPLIYAYNDPNSPVDGDDLCRPGCTPANQYYINHQVTLNGLQANRIYHFQITSRDSAGNPGH